MHDDALLLCGSLQGVRMLLDAAGARGERLRSSVISQQSRFGLTALMFAAAVLPASNARYLPHQIPLGEGVVHVQSPAAHFMNPNTPSTFSEQKPTITRGLVSAFVLCCACM